MNLTELRKATHLDHEAVEGSMRLMQPDLDSGQYAGVLWRLLGIVEAWEQRVRTGLPDRLEWLAAERSRTNLLRLDLEKLHMPDHEVPHPQLPNFENLAELLGAMYVMEGSRLGGQLIARHVDAVLGFDTGEVSRYFRGFGNETRAKWLEFARVLEAEITEQETPSAIRGAKKMFAAFGGWMRGMDRTGQTEGHS